MQYYYTNLSIYDEIQTDDLDLTDEVYDEFCERVDSLFEGINEAEYGLDYFNYAGKEEEDLNLVIGIEDGKDPEIVKKFEQLMIEKLTSIVKELEQEYGVTVEDSAWEFELDEDGMFGDEDDLDESKKGKKCCGGKCGKEEKNVNEGELTEAELSSVAGSLASICKKYLTGSFFDKLASAYGISQAKDVLLQDVNNILGHGTAKTGKAALAFINGIKRANNQVKVDQILTNVMLAGDGMSNKIGFTEAKEEPLSGFRAYLAEKKKAKEEEKCDKNPLCVSEAEIEEAKKTVEAEGYTVREKKRKKCCEEEEPKKEKMSLEEALEIAKATGIDLVNEGYDYKSILLECNGLCEPLGLKSLIDDAIATGNVEAEAADLISDIEVKGGNLLVILTESAAEKVTMALKDGIEQFLENAPGIEVEVGEDVIDNWRKAFE